MSYTVKLTRRERQLLLRALTVWKRQLRGEPRGYDNQDPIELIQLRTRLVEQNIDPLPIKPEATQ